MNTFIERLNTLSKEKKVSRKELCNYLGIGINQIKRWEDSGAIPNQGILIAISVYFGVTVDYLLGNTDIREKAEEEKTPSKILENEPMSEKEKQMWELWHRVPDEQKPQMLKLIEAALALKAEEYKKEQKQSRPSRSGKK